MKVIEYLQAKYNKKTPTTMSKIEAKAFGIPFPLRTYWLNEFGDKQISKTMLDAIESGFKKREKKQIKKGNITGLAFTQRALEIAKKSYLNPKPAKQKRAYWVDPKSDEFLLSWEWKKLRMKVLVKYGATCMCCGASKDDGVRIHVDHIKPRSKFPKLALVEDNLQVLCEVCNQGKSNIDMTDWRPKGGTGYDPAKQFGQYMQLNKEG